MKKRVRDAAEEEVLDIMAEVHMTLFAGMESRNSDYANELRPDFEEFMRVNNEVFQNRRATIDDVFERLPQNKWVHILKHLQSRPELLSRTPQEERQASKAFRAGVQRRLKGLHKH